MSKHGSRGKTLIIAEDEEEMNPFSFKEFLRSKDHNLDQDQDLVLNRDQDLVLNRDQEPDEDQSAWEVEIEEGGRSFQSDVSSSSHCGEDEEEEHDERASRCEGGAHYEGDDEMSILQPNTSSRGRIRQLQQENRLLRRTMVDLQRASRAQQQRAEVLEEELRRRRRREQQEAQDMETMVQSVEQNLDLMTKRALRAEGSVSTMRAELELLQAQVKRLRSENDGLKSAESDVVTAMKRNAQVASDYLDKTASHAHSSVCQLLEGAESLRLVSQLLRSMDKVWGVTSES
ncbi:endosome-associated-trafficking regulator 1 isoform X2 [Entelurus aequoreus]|uniref:endosome-associated-trafficking regulator 1 isoform X2 n=1 Tax=Entelurus aequoreus TaxID=161455 RepID=UPI002B1D0410|nr:endosome-associated-trafficking regulator 1 isoform X2 [Entelurus aequoreus]